MTVEERFMSKILVDEKTNCWEYQAKHYYTGYAHFKVNNKTWLAHRFAYETFVGNIQDNLCVLHKCDNRKCVSPKHLFLGTRDENMKDMVKKNRQAKGVLNGRNKLSEIEVMQIKKALIKNKFGLISELSKKYNVSRAVIYDIKQGKRWSHIEID